MACLVRNNRRYLQYRFRFKYKIYAKLIKLLYFSLLYSENMIYYLVSTYANYLLTGQKLKRKVGSVHHDKVKYAHFVSPLFRSRKRSLI